MVVTVVRGPWLPHVPPRRPSCEPTKLEATLRASLQKLGVEVPAAAAAESDVVPMADGLARVSPAFNLQIASFAEAFDIATKLCKTSFVPESYRGRPEEALAAIVMGGELGLGPMQSLIGIAVINGKPTVWGDTALALVQVHPHFDGHAESFNADRTVATCIMKRKGRPDVVRTFSMADANKARLLQKQNTPWQTYPHRMLQMRARAWAMRDQFADALRGMQIREEVLDYDSHTGQVTVANDVPVHPREVSAEVVEPKPLPPAPKPLPPAANGGVRVQPVDVVLTGADFVVQSGTNKGKKMGDLKDATIEWYATQCQDQRTKEAAVSVQTMRRNAVNAAISRAQQAQAKAQAEEQAPSDEPVAVYDSETGEVMS